MTPRPEKLTLAPIARFQGELALPGSKSLSNRVLLLAALAQGETVVDNLLDSDDVGVMLAALEMLGVPIARQPKAPQAQDTTDGPRWGSGPAESLRVTGRGGALNGGGRTLFLGNAGTAMRPLAAVLAAGASAATLTGVPRMHQRPIGDLVEGLGQLGAAIGYLGQQGYPPLKIEGGGLAGGTARVKGTTSSQFLTALLLAAPLARGPVELAIADRLVSRPYVDMTRRLMAQFGVKVEEIQGGEAPVYRVAAPQTYRSPGRVLVEGDASTASYFLAGAAITGGRVRVTGVGSRSLQGDAQFAQVLEQMGAGVRWEEGAITVEGQGPLTGVDADMVAMPDAAMTLAVAALFARGETRIRGIANWRVKETDRMAAVAAELERLGANTLVEEDTLTIFPPEKIRSADIQTYDDHRMAMAFSLAACGGVPVTILDPLCVSKTFPEYFLALEKLTVRV
ncbi:MAG: 3-phosphoshikimate 1-carboxyvinyltransferase [Deltaproteobacteria bacterium]|nr:3-phosphoshikimate 1-carboxyvinyltransferase [Deltaproteobacteria bacterium]